MANWNRVWEGEDRGRSGWADDAATGDERDFDRYVRNEYRAERGAYRERKPFYLRRNAADDPGFGYVPGLVGDDYLAEGLVARTGPGAPLDDRPFLGPYGPYGYDRRLGPGDVHGRGDDWRLHDDEARSRAHSRIRPGQDAPDYRGDRNVFERAYDEVASFLGSEAAEHRRERDAMQGDPGARHHRGRGPKNYTRSDARICEDVNDRLTDDPYVDATDVDVLVRDGEVTLNGTVPSRDAKRRAEDIADAVSGVRHVQNNLRVT